MLKDLNNIINMLRELITINKLNTKKVSLTTSKYNKIDLNKLEAKSKVKTKVKKGKIIKAANKLCIIS